MHCPPLATQALRIPPVDDWHSRRHLYARTLKAMVAVVVFLVLLIGLDVAVLLGWTPDTRDPDYQLGKVLAPRQRGTAADREVHTGR